MSTAVLIPYRAGCEQRNRALMHVISRHAENGWPIILGHHTDGPWCKAFAVRDALEQTDADVLAICDADVWTDGLAAAVCAVRDGAAWAVPHRGVYRLTEAATALYVGGYGQLASGADLETEERPYLGFEGGGMTVLRRDVYEDCPLDPRFIGWGCEDDSWGFALRTLHGAPWRPTGYCPLVHLWHPPQERATRSFGSLESRELRKRYARAQGQPDAMRTLIEEAACHSQTC